MSETTKKEFELFSSYVRKAQDVLAIEYNIFLKHERLEGNKYAEIVTDTKGHVARISFNKKRVDDQLSKEMKRAAIHEVLHTCLSRLSAYAEDRNATLDDLSPAEEEIIRKLEKLLVSVI